MREIYRSCLLVPLFWLGWVLPLVAHAAEPSTDRLALSTTMLGLVAGSLTTFAFFPQLWKTWKSRSAEDISLTWLSTFTTGISLWLLYGLAIGSLPVILSNAVTLVLTLLILYFKLRWR